MYGLKDSFVTTSTFLFVNFCRNSCSANILLKFFVPRENSTRISTSLWSVMVFRTNEPKTPRRSTPNDRIVPVCSANSLNNICLFRDIGRLLLNSIDKIRFFHEHYNSRSLLNLEIPDRTLANSRRLGKCVHKMILFPVDSLSESFYHYTTF